MVTMRIFGCSVCEKFSVNKICNCLKLEVLIAVLLKYPSFLQCYVVSLGGKFSTTVQDLKCVYHEYGGIKVFRNVGSYSPSDSYRTLEYCRFLSCTYR
jgi:hypothetical protein